MHRLALLATTAALFAALPATAGASTDSCDANPAACTTLRFVQQCAPIIVEEVKETIATGRPQSIACPL